MKFSGILFYIAGLYERKNEFLVYKKELEEFNHQVVSQWLWSEDTLPRVIARRDIDDIARCNWMIYFPTAEKGSGHKIEYGIALALNKKISIISVEKQTGIFYSLIPLSQQYSTWLNFMTRNF